MNVELTSQEVVFNVIDDGIGISEDRVKQTNKEMNEDYFKEEHIGLANVNQLLFIVIFSSYIEIYLFNYV